MTALNETLLSDDLKASLLSGKLRLAGGDMLLDGFDRSLFKGIYRASEHSSRRWSRGQVYYRFAGLSSNGQNSVRNALRSLSTSTSGCVSFTEVDHNYRGAVVQVVDQGGCFSQIGRVGPYSSQALSLGQNCLQTGIIQHEFIHALGFYHEQSRPDRDNHITVHWNNIFSNMCHNFDRCRGCATSHGYDINSIMQYESSGFSCNNRYTMTTRAGGYIGYKYNLTPMDISKIRAYYQCNGNGPSPVA